MTKVKFINSRLKKSILNLSHFLHKWVLQDRQLRYTRGRDDDCCDHSYLHLMLRSQYAEVDGDLQDKSIS